MATFEPVQDMHAAAGLMLSQGFAVIEVGNRVQWETAKPIFQGLRIISGLPPNIQELLRVDRSNNRDQDDGWMPRRPKDVNPSSFDASAGADHKNIFHYRDGLREFLWDKRAVLTGVEWNPFFDAQRRLRDVSIQIAEEIAVEIDRITESRWRVQEGLRDNREQSKLRSQLYLGERPDRPGVIAREHPDRSGITVHLLEDHPGLQIRTWDDEVRVVHAAPGRVIVFAGSQLQQLTGGKHIVREADDGKIEDFVEGGEVQALLHGARLIDTDQHPWTGTRAMCVSFIKLINDSNDIPFETN